MKIDIEQGEKARIVNTDFGFIVVLVEDGSVEAFGKVGDGQFECFDSWPSIEKAEAGLAKADLSRFLSV